MSSLALLIDSVLIVDKVKFSFFSPLASLLTTFKYKKYSVKIPCGSFIISSASSLLSVIKILLPTLQIDGSGIISFSYEPLL